jgi:hypothetical protein
MSINGEQQTTVVPDAAPTEYVALAWSDDDDDILFADDDDDAGYLRAFLRGFGVTLGVLLPVAAIVVLSILLFRAENTAPEVVRVPPPGSVRVEQVPPNAWVDEITRGSAGE